MDLINAENLEVGDLHRGWVLLVCELLVDEARSIAETSYWLRKELKTAQYAALLPAQWNTTK